MRRSPGSAYINNPLARIGLSMVAATGFHGAVALGLSAIAVPAARPQRTEVSFESSWIEPAAATNGGAGPTPEPGPAPSAPAQRRSPAATARPDRQPAATPPAAPTPAEDVHEGTAIPIDSDGDSGGGQAQAGVATGGATTALAGTGSVGDGGGFGDGRGAGAQLISDGDPCAGYFPASTQVAHGSVRLRLFVDAQGRALSSSVVDEAPRNAGFGQAAQACARRLRFVPARSARGELIADQLTIALRFDRR